jgi:hypothetical protein
MIPIPPINDTAPKIIRFLLKEFSHKSRLPADGLFPGETRGDCAGRLLEFSGQTDGG